MRFPDARLAVRGQVEGYLGDFAARRSRVKLYGVRLYSLFISQL